MSGVGGYRPGPPSRAEGSIMLRQLTDAELSDLIRLAAEPWPEHEAQRPTVAAMARAEALRRRNRPSALRWTAGRIVRA